MVTVVPFRALRPVREYAERVAALPYDTLSVEEARELVQSNSLSFLRVEKAECDLPDDRAADEASVAVRARENLEALVKNRILFQDSSPFFYLYRQQMGNHVQTGIVACVSVEDYLTRRIKTHEHTLAGKERERILHIDTVDAQTGPVFLTYRNRADIDALVVEAATGDPEYDFVAADGIRHTVWIIENADTMRSIRDAFTRVEALYIADGHHRAAAAARVARQRNEKGREIAQESNAMLAVLFPDNQLRIMDYNRAVRDLNGLDEKSFLRRIAEYFEITENFQEKLPCRPHTFGMYLAGRWRLLTARAAVLRQDGLTSGLDVSILQENILGAILGIANPRTDDRISFIGGTRGARGLEDSVDTGGFAVAFSLFPPTMEQLMAIADAGEVMPPKSTWFEPKLRSGLFVHPIN